MNHRTRAFVKNILPPFCIPLIRSLKALARRTLVRSSKPIYNPQVYFSNSDLPIIRDDLWNCANWIEHVEDTLRDNWDMLAPNIHQQGLIDAFTIAYCIGPNRKLQVLDIGGGCGVYYPVFKKGIALLDAKYAYKVIDSASNCKLGMKYFPNDTGIVFLNADRTKLTDLFTPVMQSTIPVSNVVNISSTLQYILDWRDFLRGILSHAPTTVCISRLPICENTNTDAFAIQNVTSSKGFCGSTAVNLFGSDSIVSFMRDNHYNLVLEDFVKKNDTNYFENGCSDSSYTSMTLKSLVFCKEQLS
jgi:putative methyltransferase (TIGR04325 family)